MSTVDEEMEELNKLTPQEIKEKYQELKQDFNYFYDNSYEYDSFQVLCDLAPLALKLDKEDAQDLINLIKENKLLDSDEEIRCQHCDQRSMFILSNIMRNHPEFAPEIKQLAKENFNPIEESSYILTAQYRFMGNLVKAEPQTAPKVIKEVENLMKSDENNEYSYGAAYDTLVEIIKVDPKFETKAFELVKDSFNNPIVYENCRTIEAFKFAGKAVQVNPELAGYAYEFMAPDLYPKNLRSRINQADVGKALIETLNVISKVRPDMADSISSDIEELDKKIQKVEEERKERRARIKRNRAEDDEALNANVVGVEINPDKQGLINSAKERITAAKTAKTTEEPEKPTPSNGGHVPPINNGNDGR